MLACKSSFANWQKIVCQLADLLLPVKDIYIDGLTRGKTLRRTYPFLFHHHACGTGGSGGTGGNSLCGYDDFFGSSSLKVMTFSEFIPQKS